MNLNFPLSTKPKNWFILIIRSQAIKHGDWIIMDNVFVSVKSLYQRYYQLILRKNRMYTILLNTKISKYIVEK